MKTQHGPGPSMLVLLLGVASSAGVTWPARAATTWYVNAGNPSCSDVGPGSSSQPLCTISEAGKRTGPGDTVLVSPGTYREQVTPPTSGSPGSPITYRATAPGVLVLGSLDVSDPAGWSSTATNAWSRPYAPPSSPAQVFKDGVLLAKASSATTTTTDSWFWDSSTKVLYVDVGGPNPGVGHVIEAGARTYGFNLAGRSDVVVDGFVFRNQNHSAVRLFQSSALTARGSTISYTGAYGILVDQGTSPITVEANEVSRASSTGIKILDSTGVTVSRNTSHENGNHGISLSGSNGNVLRGNVVYLNKRPDVRAANGVDINGGSSDNLIEANLAYSNDDSGFQAFNGSNRNRFVRNVSRNNGDHGFDTNDSPDTRYVSNTSYKNFDHGFNVEGNSVNVSMENNISVDNGLTTGKYDLRVEASSVAGFSSDYDVIWDTVGGDVIQYNSAKYSSLAAFTAATGHEAHGAQADPQFVNPASGDLHLDSSSSKAVDSADAAAVGFTPSDFDGRLPVDVIAVANTGNGSPPFADRGAFEFDAPPLASLNVTPSSGAPPLPVTANASASSDPDTTGIASYTFDFGDGTVVGPQVGATAGHTYGALGTYSVTVTVADTAGLTSSASTLVFVQTCASPAPNDTVCNGLDDDCDGLIDEDYVPTATTCGTGACASTGVRSCVNGSVVDSCQPGTPAANDSVCNGVDDDCDGLVDEEYVPVTTHCGTGNCASTGSTSCVNGVVVDSCVPGGGPCEDEIHWTITGPTSVTADWRGLDSTVAFGPTPSYGQTVPAVSPVPVPFSSAGPFWEARLTGLQPGAVYHYSVGGGTDHTFRTAPAPGSACFTSYVEGDIGDSGSYSTVASVQSLIAADLPRFTLVVGDLSYGDIHGQTHVDQHFNDVMVWSMDAAYMPVWGDHEWATPAADDLRNYKGRFDLPNPQASPDAPAPGCCGKDWSWFDYGNVRFISYPDRYTDLAWSTWSRQAGQLMDEAEANASLRYIVTFGHQPAYSSGHHPGSPTLQNYLGALGAAHPKYVLNLNGHSHDYERTFPQSGVVHVTVGTGGAPLEQDGPCLWLTCQQPAWSAFRAMHLGALHVRFTPTGIEGSFVCGPAGTMPTDITCGPGSIVDRFTIGVVATTDATCDGVDEDCDGLVDEDFEVQPTTCGIGACASAGLRSCVGGVVQDSCMPGTPSLEVCDGQDNDCNGVTDDVAPPGGSPSLSLAKPVGVPTELRWNAMAGATGYDVVRGSLGDLRSSGGDFALATDDCLANDLAATSTSDPTAPVPGGFWYLVRAVNCGGAGSYDSGAASQVGSRDSEIQASGFACP